MKLTRGAGSPATGGCWMVAAQQYTENAGWHDHPECVDPVIRALCIWVNDHLPDGDRERVIGPHLFAPVGTRDDQLMPARLRRVVQFSLDQVGVQHRLPELPTEKEYHAAEAAARAAAGVAGVAGVAWAAARAAGAAAEVAAGAAEVAARAAARAAEVAAGATAGARDTVLRLAAQIAEDAYTDEPGVALLKRIDREEKRGQRA